MTSSVQFLLKIILLWSFENEISFSASVALGASIHSTFFPCSCESALLRWSFILLMAATKKIFWRTAKVVFITPGLLQLPLTDVQISSISSMKKTTSAQKIQQASIILSVMVSKTSVLHTLARRVVNSRWMKSTGELRETNAAAHSSPGTADLWQRSS